MHVKLDFYARKLVEDSVESSLNTDQVIQSVEQLKASYESKYDVELPDNIGAFELDNIQVNNIRGNYRYLINHKVFFKYKLYSNFRLF